VSSSVNDVTHYVINRYRYDILGGAKDEIKLNSSKYFLRFWEYFHRKGICVCSLSRTPYLQDRNICGDNNKLSHLEVHEFELREYDARNVKRFSNISTNTAVLTQIAPSQSHIATDGQSVRQSVNQSLCFVVEPHDRILNSVWLLLYCLCGAPSLTRGRMSLVSHCQHQYERCHNVEYIYILRMYVRTIYTWHLSIKAQYSRLYPILNSFCYNGSLVNQISIYPNTRR
jgi:hypothetical protein